MSSSRKRTRKPQRFTLAAASEAVGTVMGRAVGRVERIVKLARQRIARGGVGAAAVLPSALRRDKPKKRVARPTRRAARTRA
jgi:hypothetical protein